MVLMRSISATLALLAVLATACTPAGPTIEPKTGPAATPDATPADPSSSPGPSATPDPEVATFDDQNVYPGGLRVEVTKIKHSELTKLDTEVFDSDAKAGAPYVDFTVRVVNGTKSRLTLLTSESVTYGPDGEDAEEVYVGDAPGDISATVLPGKSRSVHVQHVISKKYQDHVQMEFSIDDNHPPAVFAGSVK
jgi:hypothetical protein